MTVIFVHVLRTSLAIIPAILLLLLLSPIIVRRYSARLRCFVWMMILARLLIPIQFSIRKFFQTTSTISNLLGEIDRNEVVIALLRVLNESEAVKSVAGQSVRRIAINSQNLWYIWLAGVLIFICYNLISYRIVKKNLQRWSLPVTDALSQRIFQETKQRFSVSDKIALYRTTKPIFPILIGLSNATIYIPERQMSESELANILAHELCHYKRKDLLLKIALLIATAIHWFNPIVFFMLRQIELDIEIACDDDVLRDAPPAIRKQYCLTIFSFLDEANPIPALLTTNFLGGKQQMKLRFLDIIHQNNKKSGFFFLVLIVVVVALCGVWSENSLISAGQTETNIDNLQQTSPINMQTLQMSWPVPGFYAINSAFGWRYGNTDYHRGIDIGGENVDGAAVIAAETGTVVQVNREYIANQGYGMFVVLQHDDSTATLYGHLSEVLVETGDAVEKGQIIAKVGSTGFSKEPNLQFEVIEGGVAVNPIPYLMPVSLLS